MIKLIISTVLLLWIITYKYILTLSQIAASMLNRDSKYDLPLLAVFVSIKDSKYNLPFLAVFVLNRDSKYNLSFLAVFVLNTDSKYNLSFLAGFVLNTDSKYNLPLIELCLCVKQGLQVHVCHSYLCVKQGLQVHVCHSYLCVKQGLQVQLTTHSYPCVISSKRDNGSPIIFNLDRVYDQTASVRLSTIHVVAIPLVEVNQLRLPQGQGGAI